MDPDSLHHRLSHITTLWTLVRQAHAASEGSVATAREVLMDRYGGAAHRYLLGSLRDPEAADELFQEFALRVIRGDFKNADPQRGRFRDFVKTTLFHLICDHQRRQRNRPLSLEPGADVARPQVLPEEERAFLDSWREELLERTWLALAALERETGQPCFTVLRLRTDHPLLSSAHLAEQLGSRLGKTFTIDGARQALHRAREKFTSLLLEEVQASLETADPDLLEQELIDLGLLGYCRAALDRTRQRNG